MRRLSLALLFVAFAFAVSAQAQPPAPQYVPAGGMSAGCPSTWAHRDGGPTFFACRDSRGSAFCNGSYRAPAGVTQADEAAAAHARITAMGFVIQRESDIDGMHAIVYDDSAGNRVMQFVRRSGGQVVLVTCGSDPSVFAATVPTFVALARMAR